jgi:hypothetical protein
MKQQLYRMPSASLNTISCHAGTAFAKRESTSLWPGTASSQTGTASGHAGTAFAKRERLSF